MTDLAQILVMLAAPATVLLGIRHLNRRGDRLYSQSSRADHRAVGDTTRA